MATKKTAPKMVAQKATQKNKTEEAPLKSDTKKQDGSWPKYLMKWWTPDEDKKNKKRKFCSLYEAGVFFDSGFLHVEIGIYVLNEDMSVRRMTDKDEKKISDAADEYSASK